MRFQSLFFAFVLLLSACSSTQPITPTPDVQKTLGAISGTMLAQTLTAQPSITPEPSETPRPTSTIKATPTAESPSETPSPILPTDTPTRTATPWSGAFVPGNIEGLPTGFLRIENNTGVKEITVTLNGVTLTREQPVYYSYKVTGFLVLTIPWASYKYIVQIPNKRMMTGSFTQANKDKTTMRVSLTQVTIIGP